MKSCFHSALSKNPFPRRASYKSVKLLIAHLELQTRSIEEVVHDKGVVHEVGEVCRNGEVTETHHLLGCVDDDRVVDAGPVWLWILLQEQPRGEKNNYCYFPPK